MNRLCLLALSVVTAGLVASFTFAGLSSCSESEKPKGTPSTGLEPIALPSPVTQGGKPLMTVLKERKSSRSFRPERLPLPVLSNLLWAGFGVNRPESGKRTAPSAMNWQEIDIYAATESGLYVYDAKANVMQPVLARDVRAETGRQAFVKQAPVNLVYVADFSRMKGSVSEADKSLYAAASTGCIVQNVYLFCASEGLATVVRGSIDKPALRRIMKLRPEQKIILAQSVGYPQ